MAVKKIIDLEVQSNADEAVGSLRTQLRLAQQEVAALSEKFGATSKEAVEAAKRAAELKDRIGDAKALTDAFNPDAKFKSLSASLSGVAGGFSAVQGAMVLMGNESEAVEKSLLKVQSAMALSQGLQALGESADSFKQLKAVAVNAMNSIKAAIGATGIGLLVVALGAIYTYWDDIKEVVSGVSEEQEKLNAETAKDVALNKKKLDSISAQDNILKLQGKTEREILQIKIKQTDEAIKAGEAQITAQIATNKAQVEIAKRNKDILEGLLKLVSLPITAVLKGIDLIGDALGENLNLSGKFFGGMASFVFNPEEVSKKGEETLQAQRDALVKLKNDRAGYVLGIQNIDKQAADKAAEDAKANADKLLEIEKKKYENLKKEADDFFEKGRQAQEEFDKNLDNQLNKLNSLVLPEDQAVIDAEKKAKELESFNGTLSEKQTMLDSYYQWVNDNEMLSEEQKDFYRRQGLEREKILNSQRLDLTQQTLGKLTTIFGESSKAGKAFAVAQALINTYQGITAELATKAVTPYEIGLKVVNVAFIAKTGFDAVKKILATQTNGSGGGASMGGMVGAAPQAQPQFNVVGNTGVNALANSINQQPIQAYVVAQNVTSAQSMNRNIVQSATLG